MESDSQTTPLSQESDNAAALIHAAPQLHAAPQRGVWMGRFGLRAGWAIGIFLVVWFIFSTLGGAFGVAATGQLSQIMNARMQAQANPKAPHKAVHITFYPLMPVVSDSVQFAAVLGLCWFFSRAERRRLGVYGLGRNRLRDFFPGALWGLVIMAALVAMLRALHLLIFDGRALHGFAVLLYGVKWLVAFLMVGLAEEYAFRGYVQFTLMRGVWGLAERLSPTNPRPLAFWFAATILSLLFAGLHTSNAGETHFGLVAVFLAGMTFSYVLWRTGSLWWAVGFHMAWDWAQSFLFGVADSGNVSAGRLFITHPSGNPLLSGGSDGPEGSVFVCGALLLTVMVLRFTRSGMQPAVEQGSRGTALPHEAATAIS